MLPSQPESPNLGKSKLNLTVNSRSQTGRITSGEHVCAEGVKVRREGFFFLPHQGWRNGETLPLSLGGGGDAGRSQQSTPVIPIKGWKGLEETCPSSRARPAGGGAGVPAALPSMPHVVPLPTDGKYWCCDFINKGFCEPEKHGIRMNYFLSCGLARFANLGVFGPSPGNKPKSLSKRHRCSGKGRSSEE